MASTIVLSVITFYLTSATTTTFSCYKCMLHIIDNFYIKLATAHVGCSSSFLLCLFNINFSNNRLSYLTPSQLVTWMPTTICHHHHCHHLTFLCHLHILSTPTTSTIKHKPIHSWQYSWPFHWSHIWVLNKANCSKGQEVILHIGSWFLLYV